MTGCTYRKVRKISDVMSLLRIGRRCQLPWFLKLFAQNGSVLPQKSSLSVLLSPIVVLTVSSMESMWPVQTNGSDLLKSWTRQEMF